MILDTSAILAVFLQEPGYEAVLEALVEADAVGIGAPTLVETGIVLEARFGAEAVAWLQQFAEGFRLTEIPFGSLHRREAVAAYARFGRGRRQAGLNYGDCLTYAVARLAGQPLLCVGDDFALTDLELAPGGARGHD
ncbi:MAG: type II toxin-antitoxin system VapC family toxin [Thermoleophilia bacterium]|nr:type II toxin-antitoxin system VapC family toxin [Thermoleophilia bacterium]